MQNTNRKHTKHTSTQWYGLMLDFMIRYMDKVAKNGFLGTPKANIFRHFAHTEKGQEARSLLEQAYAQSLKLRGKFKEYRNGMTSADYLFNTDDKVRFDTLYTQAVRRAQASA